MSGTKKEPVPPPPPPPPPTKGVLTRSQARLLSTSTMPNDLPSGEANQATLKISIRDARELIPEFSGNRSDLNRFISCCDSLFQTAENAQIKALFFNVLKTKVSGPAYDIIDYGDVNNWEDFKARLLKRYKLSRSLAREDLKRLKQLPRESVNDFSLRVTRALGELNKATTATISDVTARPIFLSENEKEAIKAFENGLRNERLQTLAQARNETDLCSLIDYVLERTSHLEERNHRETTGENFSRQQLVCEICNKRGHGKETCFRNRIIPSFSGQQIKREVRRLHCSYCNKANHSANECRARQRDFNRDTRSQLQPQMSRRHWQQQSQQRSYPQNNNSRRQDYRRSENNWARSNPMEPNQRTYNGPQTNLRQVRVINHEPDYYPGNDIQREGVSGHLSRNAETQAEIHINQK